MEFSVLAIFWMSFASFIGPVFIIALVCSIVRAVRSRREIQQKIKESNVREVQGPLDAEIITETPRRKLNFKLIEDEARKKQFRGKTGSLVCVNSNHTAPTKSNRYDTGVDFTSNRSNDTVKKGGRNMNKSNSTKQENTDEKKAPATVVTNGGHKYPNHHNYNNVDGTAINSQHHHGNSIKGDAVVDSDGLSKDTNRRRRSYDEGIPTPYSHTSLVDAYQSGGDRSSGHDKSHLDKPNPFANHSRRHSINSISPTLERIPEVKCVEVEMNATKSKSEDNLLEHQQPYSNYPPFFNAEGHGSDNRGFARSTETTIM